MPWRRIASLLFALFLCGCSSLSANHSSSKDLLSGVEQASAERPYDTKWWERLNDPAINILVEKTFSTNPTLEQALARVDEARAQSGVSRSGYFPKVGVNAGVTQNYDGSLDTGEKTFTTSIGPSLTWELDLFGRVRSSNKAAKSRLDARTADAYHTRLILAADVATTVLNFWACRSSSMALEDDVVSRKESLGLLHKKIQTGFSTTADGDSAKRDLAYSSINLALQNELCENNANALVALSGMDKTALKELIGPSRLDTLAFAIPEPLQMSKDIEATTLMNHPGVRAATYDAEAALADIDIAKAERLPRLDLLALLTGQWISAAETTLDFTTWALGATFSGTILDGGFGAATVDASEARYRETLAVVKSALRTAVQEAQDALAAQQSAKERHEAAITALKAAQSSFTVNEAQWKNGSASLLELEDSRRQLLTAQINLITAKRDRAVAWIALQRVLGEPTESKTY